VTLLLNILILIFVASPLVLLESLRSRSKWIEEHHGGLSIIVWLATLFVVYVFVLPMFNMKPNSDFFRH
jgi:hypothetical protein